MPAMAEATTSERANGIQRCTGRAMLNESARDFLRVFEKLREPDVRERILASCSMTLNGIVHTSAPSIALCTT